MSITFWNIINILHLINIIYYRWLRSVLGWAVYSPEYGIVILHYLIFLRWMNSQLDPTASLIQLSWCCQVSSYFYYSVDLPELQSFVTGPASFSNTKNLTMSSLILSKYSIRSSLTSNHFSFRQFFLQHWYARYVLYD